MDGMAATAQHGEIDGTRIATALDERGYAVIPGLLTPAACEGLATLYEGKARFRSRVVMERHAYGVGEYQYFDYPLPPPVAALRAALYRQLAPVANGWARRLGQAADYPAELDGFLRRCHAAGQAKATPLLLRYEAGGFNCLHQDRYGAIAFPLQATVLLSRPGSAFSGGEFVLVEQRPRAQSRAEIVPLGLGDAVIFPNALRPVAGTRGDYRVNLRHGVSRVTAGRPLHPRRDLPRRELIFADLNYHAVPNACADQHRHPPTLQAAMPAASQYMTAKSR